MQTAALAAYIQSRNMRFAGAPVTLGKLLKMWQLPHDGTAETIDGDALEGVARYCKLSVEELTAAVAAMIPPATFVGGETVTVPGIGRVEISAPVRLPGLPPQKPAPDPTTEIPKEQLGDLIDASRPSSPVIEGPTELSGPEPDDHDIDISFEDVEPTPIPDGTDAASTVDATKSGDAKSGKSKKQRKKKS